MAKFESKPYTAASPAVTSTGVSETVPPTPEQAQAAIDASIAQASAETKANALAAFQADFPQLLPVPATGGGDGGGGLSTLAVIALGLVAAGAVVVLSSGRRGRR